MVDLNFWKNKKVLITGHSGFKGSWLSVFLKKLGANIMGVSLSPPTNPSMYDLLSLKKKISDKIFDIRDKKKLIKIFNLFKPEIVFHLAAQPLVGKSYYDPVETYSVNVMGPLNVLEAIRFSSSVKSAVMITTDKCYKNNEWVWGYRENDQLGGYDPYSSSKASAEILIKSYCESYFNNNNRLINVASARAGNVIGGGDWAEDRLIPDIFKSIYNGQKFKLRNPNSIRPWQHVLDPLNGYIILAKNLYLNNYDYRGAWNFGPNNFDTKTVIEIIKYIELKIGQKLDLNTDFSKTYKETNFLKLDSTKAMSELKWRPIWNINHSLDKTIDWFLDYKKNKDMFIVTKNQIKEFVDFYYK